MSNAGKNQHQNTFKATGFEPTGRHPKANGFTLIETIVTLVVISIAAVGVISVFTVGMRSSANPTIFNQAIQLAQGEMERVVADKALIGFFAPDLDPLNPPSCSSTMPTGFTCSRIVDFVQPADLTTPVTPTQTEYIRATVTISNAAIGKVSLVSLITNY
jgi:prepilin-type N-terminal cleavage/methylation domain-containing protein